MFPTFPSEEAAVMRQNHEIGDRVVTYDGPGEVIDVEQYADGAFAYVVRLDAGTVNTFDSSRLRREG